jgi:hypothetical protein
VGLLAVSLLSATITAATPAEIDAAFKKFWAAADPRAAARVANEIIELGVSFDEAHARLKRGRTYAADVPRGVVRLRHRFSLGDFWYSVEVPKTYDPQRAYQVRIQLHGGVGGRTNGTIRGTGSIGALAGADQIYVLPAAWRDAPWWHDSQIENLRAILDTVKRRYNVDENRVTLAGVSDGATGTYYFAMRDTTPYASFDALNGALAVLQNSSIRSNGSLFPQNLVNKPYFIINGGRDRLYPISDVQPYVNHLMKSGVKIVYHPRPDGEHNTRWWPEEKDAFEAFVRDHPRKPLPDRLTWETDLVGDVNRSHWLVIDKLMGNRDERPPLLDVNMFDRGPQEDLPKIYRIPPTPLFPSRRPSGRVDLVREGNTIRATTRGVTQFTLLISPDVVDFAKPVKVIADDRVVFDGPVQTDLATLMKWAARDNDRTMLFGAEIGIKLP